MCPSATNGLVETQFVSFGRKMNNYTEELNLRLEDKAIYIAMNEARNSLRMFNKPYE